MKIKDPSQSLKRSHSDLMEMADDSEEYESQGEQLYDSDMGREDDYEIQSQNNLEIVWLLRRRGYHQYFPFSS